MQFAGVATTDFNSFDFGRSDAEDTDLDLGKSWGAQEWTIFLFLFLRFAIPTNKFKAHAEFNALRHSQISAVGGHSYGTVIV